MPAARSGGAQSASHGKPAEKPRFAWEDPLLVEDQLSEEERMLRDAARAYAADPRGQPA
jgi:glutaryl-CoA dehydrogenase